MSRAVRAHDGARLELRASPDSLVGTRDVLLLYVALYGSRRDATGSHHHAVAFDEVLRNGGARPGPTHLFDAADGNIKAGGNFAGMSAACTGQRQEEKNELPNGFHTANFAGMELYRTWTQEKPSGRAADAASADHFDNTPPAAARDAGLGAAFACCWTNFCSAAMSNSAALAP